MFGAVAAGDDKRIGGTAFVRRTAIVEAAFVGVGDDTAETAEVATCDSPAVSLLRADSDAGSSAVLEIPLPAVPAFVTWAITCLAVRVLIAFRYHKPAIARTSMRTIQVSAAIRRLRE